MKGTFSILMRRWLALLGSQRALYGWRGADCSFEVAYDIQVLQMLLQLLVQQMLHIAVLMLRLSQATCYLKATKRKERFTLALRRTMSFLE